MIIPTQDPLADAIRLQMRVVRRELKGDIHDLTEQARQLTDWRHYVAQSPLLSVAAAATAGFFIVPTRAAASTTISSDVLNSTVAAKTTMDNSAKAATSEGVGSFLFRMASSMVMRSAIGFAGQQIASLLDSSSDDSKGSRHPVPQANGKPS